jgi:hypothetical protein
MATGGIFQLITNDGKQDRMLMASALLKQRIEAATKRREDSNESDTTPTLYDIERTHILFTNAHFKPFAAIGYEYNKVTLSAGAASLGSKVTFSIPQFGDFFNDMIVHAVITQPVLNTTNAEGEKIPKSQQNLIRWCAYPGERLLKNVKFEVNGNPLDEYTSDAVNYWREFCVQPNKEVAWNRCVGQEEPQSGFLDQPNWAGSDVASNDISYRTKMDGCNGLQTPSGVKTEDVELFIPLLFWCNKDPRLAVPSVAIPYGQRFITIELATAAELTGEVPRGYAAGSTPAQIWDNTNIAKGGKIGTPADLRTIELYINNIFVNPEVHNIFIKRIGFTLIRVHRRQTGESQGGSESVLLQQLKWPIEALFVGMRVKEYANGTSDNTRQHLDKWHTFCTVKSEERHTQGYSGTKATVVTAKKFGDLVSNANVAMFSGMAAGSSPQLSLSDPVNGGIASATGIVNVGDVLTFSSTLGGALTGKLVGPLTVANLSVDGTVITFVEDSTSVPNYGDVSAADVSSDAFLATSLVLAQSTKSELAYHVDTHHPNLTNVTIKAHGIAIYGNFPSGFFNAYIPYNYGGHNIRAPRDVGALLITFCLYPGSYQPSGHINISRAREFYIDFDTSSLINGQAGNRGTLIVVASAINFLLISDGSAVLRYST